MKHMNSPWSYLAVVFLLSYLGELIMYLTGNVDFMYLPLVMLIPASVAIVYRIMNKEGFKNVGWGLRKWWYVIPSVLVPLVVILCIAGLFVTLNWATPSDEYFVFRDGKVEIQKIPMILGNQVQSLAFFGLNLALSLLVQSLIGSVITIGEEFGWRGYIQEKLIRRFGLNRGLVLLGMIWGYWHLPIGLMGWNFPNSPVVGALILTPISNIFIGMYLGWLYLRSKSIWMPTLAHAAFNLTATLLLNVLIIQRDDIYLQLVFIAAWGFVAGLCLISLNWKNPELWQATTYKEEAS